MKAFTALITALLLATTPVQAQAQNASLAKIDAAFVKTHFTLARATRVVEARLTEPVAAGCKRARKFQVFRQNPKFAEAVDESVLLVALCTEGALGHSKFQATVDEIVAAIHPVKKHQLTVQGGGKAVERNDRCAGRQPQRAHLLAAADGTRRYVGCNGHRPNPDGRLDGDDLGLHAICSV